jgi:hypothetical protein
VKKNVDAMFDFIVKYLGFLKRVPLFPQIVDASMRIFYLVFNNERVKAVDAIESTVSSWEEVTLSMHKYGGIQFNYKGKEIGHMHSNGIVDVLLDRKTKAILIEQELAENHHVLKDTGWVSVFVKNKKDAAAALSLLKISLARYKRKESLL